MSTDKKLISILVVGVSHELVESFTADYGLTVSHIEIQDSSAGAMAVLHSLTHFDLIVTAYSTSANDEDEANWLRQLQFLTHRKDTPVVMLSRRHGTDLGMSKGSNTKTRKRRTPGFTEQMKVLAASMLAQKIGYLQVSEFPDANIFHGDLPSQAYGPNKIIRCQPDELLFVKRGMVEVWQTHHDLLVKQLLIGTLFGEMPLLGQTMVMTQAVAGPAGATIGVMNLAQMEELIKANALSLAEKLYPRLASVDVEHYRVIFQQVEPRLAALLLDLAGKGSTVEGLTQRQLGEKMGLVRETVTVAVAALKVKKLIAIDRRKTTLLDRKGLEVLSRS